MIHHWDFFGPDARPTAEHFRKHFDQFAERMAITAVQQGFFSADSNHTCFWVEVADEEQTRVIKEKLRPKRSLTFSGHESLMAALADARKD